MKPLSRLLLLGLMGLGLLGLSAKVGHAQLAQLVSADNPVQLRAAQVGQIGLPPASTAKKSATAFRPARGRVLLEAYLAGMFDDATEREAMRAAITAVLGGYETEAKKHKLANDAAASLAFAVTVLHAVGTGGEMEDAAFFALAPRLRAALDTPAVRAASDRQKQEVYELALCTAATVLSLAAATEDPANQQKVRELARASVLALIGTELEALTLTATQVAIKAKGAAIKDPPGAARPAPATAAAPTAPAPAAAPLAAGALAPGFSFTPPKGWTQDAGWHLGAWRDGQDVTTALVRFPPAMEAKGSYSDALRAAWQRHIPAELSGRAHNVVFRRQVGNGLFAQFMVARGPEKGRSNDSMFSLFLVDCGAAWQPVVVAQTYQSEGAAGLDMSTGFSFPRSADIAETMLATVRCPGPVGQAIVDVRSLAGNYHFGNGASMDWINVYTGASSTTYVSYGGRLHLKDNGTFDYEYSSASNMGAGTKFAGIRANGTWKIEGDTLLVTYAKYDQGDSYRKKNERYRIASSMTYSDGEKLTILRSGSDYDRPVNAVTVTDPATYYSTKAK